MRKVVSASLLVLLAVVGSGCMGSDESADGDSRRAAIGSSAPVAGAGSITAAGLAGGAPVRVDSWQWGAASPVTVSSMSGGGIGAPTVTSIKFSKNIDNASTQLFKWLALGTNIPTVTFKVGTTLTYTLTNAWVSGFEQSGSGTRRQRGGRVRLQEDPDRQHCRRADDVGVLRPGDEGRRVVSSRSRSGARPGAAPGRVVRAGRSQARTPARSSSPGRRLYLTGGHGLAPSVRCLLDFRTRRSGDLDAAPARFPEPERGRLLDGHRAAVGARVLERALTQPLQD